GGHRPGRSLSLPTQAKRGSTAGFWPRSGQWPWPAPCAGARLSENQSSIVKSGGWRRPTGALHGENSSNPSDHQHLQQYIIAETLYNHFHVDPCLKNSSSDDDAVGCNMK